jgi:hypothetical protein
MAQRDRDEIQKALLKKGFYQKNKDHMFFYFKKNDAVFTKISRGSSYKTYGDDLLSKMSKQLRLTKQELLNFIDCPLNKENYLEILRTKGFISLPEGN